MSPSQLADGLWYLHPLSKYVVFLYGSITVCLSLHGIYTCSVCMAFSFVLVCFSHHSFQVVSLLPYYNNHDIMMSTRPVPPLPSSPSHSHDMCLLNPRR